MRLWIVHVLDHGSPFLYSLEKKCGTCLLLLVLLVNNGQSSQIRGHPGPECAYYAALFFLDLSSEEACTVLLEDLPQLRLEDAGRLNAPVTFEKLTGSSFLASMLAHMTHPDQSNTVPDRKIHDNIHLVCDLIHFVRGPRRLLGFVLYGPNTGMFLFAYADDVLLTFTNLADLRWMRECQALYSVRINWAKCSRLLVGNLNYDTQPLFVNHESLQVALKMPPDFYHDLITVWDMVYLRQAYPLSGLAAIVKTAVVQESHLYNRRVHHTFLIFGNPVGRGAGRSEDLFMSLILGLAELAIY
eukprot:g43271.t1